MSDRYYGWRWKDDPVHQGKEPEQIKQQEVSNDGTRKKCPNGCIYGVLKCPGCVIEGPHYHACSCDGGWVPVNKYAEVK